MRRKGKKSAKAAPPAGQPRLGAAALSASVAPGIFAAHAFVVHVAPAALATHGDAARSASQPLSLADELRARRRAAGALARLLRALPGVACVQRCGSGGDAFLLPAGGGPGGAFASDGLAVSAALAAAEQACAAAASQLGLALAAGVGPNKLLARLASRAAAPAGVAVAQNAAMAAEVLAATPAAALPGAAALAAPLAAAGFTTAAAIAHTTPALLAAALGCAPAEAAALLAAARGVCPDGPVAATEAPSNLFASRELSNVVAQADRPGEPQPVAAAFASLGAELASLVVDDAAEWHRWPMKLALTAECKPPLPGGPSRQLRFPPPPRGWPPRAPPDGGPPLLDAALEAELGAAIAAASAAGFDKACGGAGPARRVHRLRLMATRFEAVVAAVEPLPLPAVFPTVPSPAKRARDEAATALGAGPLDVPAMLRALAAGSLSADDARAAVDAAERRVARQEREAANRRSASGL